MSLKKAPPGGRGMVVGSEALHGGKKGKKSQQFCQEPNSEPFTETTRYTGGDTEERKRGTLQSRETDIKLGGLYRGTPTGQIYHKWAVYSRGGGFQRILTEKPGTGPLEMRDLAGGGEKGFQMSDLTVLKLLKGGKAPTVHVETQERDERKSTGRRLGPWCSFQLGGGGGECFMKTSTRASGQWGEPEIKGGVTTNGTVGGRTLAGKCK